MRKRKKKWEHFFSEVFPDHYDNTSHSIRSSINSISLCTVAFPPTMSLTMEEKMDIDISLPAINMEPELKEVLQVVKPTQAFIN